MSEKHLHPNDKICENKFGYKGVIYDSKPCPFKEKTWRRIK